jgi:hypothetical protein
MRFIRCFSDLAAYGLEPLTGEACGLMYRILFDVTAEGLRILEKCLGVKITPAEPWNRGEPDRPHVGSVMLAQPMLVPLGIFALLESGCTECWLHKQGDLMGIEPSDSPEIIERYRSMYEGTIVRRFAYRGTAGDRNVHMMSGRTV